MPPPDLSLLPDELKSALETFDAAAESLFAPHLVALEAQPPPPIFHYTGEDSLKAILGSGTFRLTDGFQLNDPTELTHGLNLLDRVFREVAGNAMPESAGFGDRMRAFVDKGGVRASAHYFVGSFSLLGDDLPQWRSYADGARGFALEFDAGRLERAFVQPRGSRFNTATFPVSYDEAEIRRMYRELVDLVAPMVSLPRSHPMSREQRAAYLYDLELRFTLAALRRNVFFKHPAYKSEREYRFLQIHQAFVGAKIETGTRLRGEEVVRFRELNWLAEARDSLTAVIIGPASVGLPGPRLRARQWLDATGLQHVPVKDSKLPYRAFDPPCPISTTSTPSSS